MNDETHKYFFNQEKDRIINELLLNNKELAEDTGRIEVYNSLIKEKEIEEKIQMELRLMQKSYMKKIK